MKNENAGVSRRQFINLVAAGVALGGASAIVGCKSEKKAAPAAAAPPQAASADPGAAAKNSAKTSGGACEDLSALSAPDKAMRGGLKYVSKSGEAGKNCANCKLLLAAPAGGKGCAGCTLFKGPVANEGYCAGWQKA